MAKRNADILSILTDGGDHTSSSIAFTLGCPEASVRRSIQELRRQGNNISQADWLGRYRMGA